MKIWVAELRSSGDTKWPYGLELLVGYTRSDPLERVASLGSSKKKRLQDAAGRLIRSRQDLCENVDYTTEAEARNAKERIVKQLRGDGHRVNGVGSVFYVYVIEMDDDVGPKTGDLDKPWLYVGETSLLPVERIRQHQSGARNKKGPIHSKRAFQHFVRGRPDLFKDIPPVHSRQASVELERQTAANLRDQGYSVQSA